jgi:ABC-type nitrate/sulfonate/bicarbonate transport system substrate-binding protein
MQRRSFLKLGGAAAMAGVASTALPRITFAQAALPKVKVLNAGGNLNEILQQLVVQQGYLKEFGVEIEAVNVQDTAAIMAGLVSGQSDVCMFAGINTLFPAIESGADVKVLAGATLKLQQAVYSANPEVKKLKDLEGRTCGVGPIGALLHAGMVALLVKNKVDVKKVKFVNVGSSANIYKAVAAKSVDAGMSTTDYLESYEKMGIHIVEGGKVWESLADYTFQGAFANGKAIREKRESLVRLLAAYGKMYRFISIPGSQESKDAFVKASVEALGQKSAGPSASLWTFMNTNQTLAVDLVLDEERIRKLQQLNVDLNVQRSIVPYDKATDMSLARDALKLMG